MRVCTMSRSTTLTAACTIGHTAARRAAHSAHTFIERSVVWCVASSDVHAPYELYARQ